jgi:hypothetical protein
LEIFNTGAICMAGLTLRYFEECAPGELVRFSDQHGTHLAFVGDRGNERLNILVLPLKGVPYGTNIMGHKDILRKPFEGAVALSYGTQYAAQIDHTGDCDVGDVGKLISTPGSYVLTGEDEFICCRFDDVPTKVAYYNLRTGKVTPEPGSKRAVFAGWDLIWSASNDQPPAILFQVRASKSGSQKPGF